MVCGRFGPPVGTCAGSVMVLWTFGDVVNTASEVGAGLALVGAPGAVALGLGVDEGDGAGELPLGGVDDGIGVLLGVELGTDEGGVGDGLGDVPDGTCTLGRLNPLQLCL